MTMFFEIFLHSYEYAGNYFCYFFIIVLVTVITLKLYSILELIRYMQAN